MTTAPMPANAGGLPTSEMRSNAFIAMESDIAELSGAAAVLDIVTRGTLARLTPETAATLFHIPESAHRGYRLYALTYEQDEALSHARLHLEDLIHQLESKYQAVNAVASS